MCSIEVTARAALAGMMHQVVEHAVFVAGQRQRLLTHPHAAIARIEHNVTTAKLRAGEDALHARRIKAFQTRCSVTPS